MSDCHSAGVDGSKAPAGRHSNARGDVVGRRYPAVPGGTSSPGVFKNKRGCGCGTTIECKCFACGEAISAPAVLWPVNGRVYDVRRCRCGAWEAVNHPGLKAGACKSSS